MADTDLLKYLLAQSGSQLNKAFESLAEELMDTKLVPTSMSPREIAEHQCEAYISLIKKARGEEHKWGEHKAADQATGSIIGEMMRLRQEAVDAALSSTDPSMRQAACDYIALHDAYHVGQIASLRVERDAAWDPFSIYAE